MKRYGLVGLLAVFGCVPGVWAQPDGPLYRISNVAGTDGLHDGGPAINARLIKPRTVAIDGAGNLYVSEWNNIRVRKIDSQGNITTVAGNGVAGNSTFGDRFGGDGGPATEAMMWPRDVAPLPDGSFYIADIRRVRYVDPEGVITTVAGNGEQVSGPDGVATDTGLRFVFGVTVGPDGLVYLAEAGGQRIRRINPDGLLETVVGTGERGYTGDGGAAVAARVSSPRDIAFGPGGELCFSDQGNHAIRCVDAGGTINTVAGIGRPGYSGDGLGAASALSSPDGIEIDDAGVLYFADLGNGLIRRITGSGELETIAGIPAGQGLSGDGGPALAATFALPRDVALQADGTVLVADEFNGRIRAIRPNGTIETIAGFGRSPNPGIEGGASEAMLHFPSGVAAASDGRVFIADTFNHTIREVTPEGRIRTVVGTGTGARGGTGPTPARELNLLFPRSVHVDRFDRLFIADTAGDVVRRLTSSGNVVRVAGTGARGFGGDGGVALAGLFNEIDDVATDADGNVYISDRQNARIRKVDGQGVLTTIAGTGTRGYSGDGGPARLAMLDDPRGLAVSPDGEVHFCDTQNHRIRKIDSEGMIHTVAGTGQKGYGGDGGLAVETPLDEPYDVEFDADGYMYFSEAYSHVVRMVTPGGVVLTIAGQGDGPGRDGDGGLAREAKLNKPKGVAVDGNGVVYVSDNDNYQVRRLTPVPYLADESVVNAASFVPGRVAPDLIVSAFGTSLAGQATAATELPLPETLADVSAVFVDSGGNETAASIFFASRAQLNLLVPSGVASGAATLRLTRGSGETAEAGVVVETVSPGLFTANANGQGVAAGFYQQTPDNTLEPLFVLEEGVFQAAAIDLGEAGTETFLTLFGTGWRNRTSREVTFLDVGGVAVPLTYEGPAPGFAGLDQLNAGPLPRELMGRGEVDVTFTATGQTTNAVTIAFR